MKIINYISNIKYSFKHELSLSWYYMDLFHKCTYENEMEYDPSWYHQFQIDGTPFIGMGFKSYMKSIAIRLKG